jgi:hypothetical protein
MRTAGAPEHAQQTQQKLVVLVPVGILPVMGNKEMCGF